jgi:hypothetical protein
MSTLALDIAHLLAGSLVLVSFLLLYQNRLYALLNVRPTRKPRRNSISPRLLP